MNDVAIRRFIDADSEEVGVILAEMTRLVLRSGGALHPGLVTVERDGDMTVRCRDAGPSALRTPLFTVPRELLIPLEGSAWADSTERLEMLTPPTGLSRLQRDAFDLHVALYNATGKIRALVRGHPRIALAGESDVLAALVEMRPGFDVVDSSQTALRVELEGSVGIGSEPIWSRGVAGLFFGCRVFGLKPEPPESDADGDTSGPKASRRRQSVLMTLIDLLNHHPRGAPTR